MLYNFLWLRSERFVCVCVYTISALIFGVLIFIWFHMRIKNAIGGGGLSQITSLEDKKNRVKNLQLIVVI